MESRDVDQRLEALERRTRAVERYILDELPTRLGQHERLHTAPATVRRVDWRPWLLTILTAAAVSGVVTALV